MKSTVAFFIICVCFVPARAQFFSGCGHYLVRGYLKRTAQGPELLVHQGSQSETRLKVIGKIPELLRFSDDLDVEVSGDIRQKLKHYRGRISIRRAELRVPNPLAPNKSQGFWKSRGWACES